jgi:predicted nucleic acid-binding protein
MPEVIADTSPLQYLHQTDLLDLLPQLYGHVLVPPAVAEELERGVVEGYNVPRAEALSWIEVRSVQSNELVLPNVQLGRGEREAITLATKIPDALAILDDRWARRHARALGIAITGTLGILLKAKQDGLIKTVGPVLERLPMLGFYIDAPTHTLILRLANEGR